MYILNTQGQVTDSQGRVLVGLDGSAITISSLVGQQPTAAAKKTTQRSTGAKRGVKAGTISRPKAPLAISMDLALCTVQQGQTEGVWFYVGEMLGRGGLVVKRWTAFSPQEIEGLTSVSQLESLAWALVQLWRKEKVSAEVEKTLLTPAQDAAKLAALEDPPSLPGESEKISPASSRKGSAL